jgi:radical SAM superfamily enzyme YgiQ (UPF0313 family)
VKILLVQPILGDDSSTESYPPIGLGYLATAVRKSGHSVYALDCLKDWEGYNSFVESVKGFSPDLIGFSLFSASIPSVRKMIAMVKKEMPYVIVIAGGPHVSALPERVLDQLEGLDFAIRGEGEIPLRKLVDYIASGRKDLHEIPGLIYRENEKVLLNSPYFADNVDEYGFPAWDLINPCEYFKSLTIWPYSAPVSLSRGCPFQCTFCAARVTSGQKLRKRSMNHIFEELRFLQKEFSIKRFIIQDEGFGVSRKFIMDFCDCVRKTKIKTKFRILAGMRLDMVDRELLAALHNSNFEKAIPLGIESGSERILKLMKKKTTLNLILEKVNLMDAMGFEPDGFFILGYPDETRDEMEQTIQLALKLPIRQAAFRAFQPYPGTEATELLIKSKELPEDYDFERGQEAIPYAPRGMATEELEQIRRRAIIRFYGRPKILFNFIMQHRHRLDYAFKYALKKVINVFLKKNAVLGHK